MTEITTGFFPSAIPGASIHVENLGVGHDRPVAAERRLHDIASEERIGRQRRRNRAVKGMNSESSTFGLAFVAFDFVTGMWLSKISKATKGPSTPIAYIAQG